MKLLCVECNKYYVNESSYRHNQCLLCKQCGDKRFPPTNTPEYFKKYYIEHRKKLREYNTQYKKKRRQDDPMYRLTSNVRSLISIAISRRSHSLTSKQHKTEQILGCSFEELYKYLEERFQEGMTWDNYGYGEDKWNIDHIIPISQAATAEEVYKLNHYTNLQPMWQVDNFKKHNNLA